MRTLHKRSLEDSEPSETSSSSESVGNSLPSLQISSKSEWISSNPEYQNISEYNVVFDQSSASEFVTLDRVPVSHH